MGEALREKRVLCNWCQKAEMDSHLEPHQGPYDWLVIHRTFSPTNRDLALKNPEYTDFCSTACAIEWLKAPARERKDA